MARSATASRRRAILFGPVQVKGVGRGRYGRLLGVVTAGGMNLSCWQLRARQARYILRYDSGRRICAACPAVAR